jgi:hypothetical protein
MKTKTESKKKTKRICPECNSQEVVPILYGMPTAQAAEEEEKGKLFIGGCCIYEDSPKWHCKACGNEWK